MLTIVFIAGVVIGVWAFVWVLCVTASRADRDMAARHDAHKDRCNRCQ